MLIEFISMFTRMSISRRIGMLVSVLIRVRIGMFSRMLISMLVINVPTSLRH